MVAPKLGGAHKRAPKRVAKLLRVAGGSSDRTQQMAPHQSPSLDSRGRAKINEPGEKLDGGEHTLEDLMAQLDSIPANKRILRQIGVRDSVMRCLSAKARHLAQEEMKDERVLALVCSLLGWEMVGAGEGPCKPLQQEPALAGF